MGVVTGTFKFPNGSPVANASFQWKLSSDAIEFSATSACIVPEIISGALDPSGNMTTTFAFNDVLSTTAGASTFYQLTVKASNGGQVWNEFYYLTGTAANLNVIAPGVGGQPPVTTTATATTILLETNNVTNTSQVVLNQLNGPGVALSANAVGGVTFSANLVAGSNITLSTSTANAITIAASVSSSGTTTPVPTGQGYLLPTIQHWQMAVSQPTGNLNFASVVNTSGVVSRVLVAQIQSDVQFTSTVLRWFFLNSASSATVHASMALYSADGNTKIIDSGVITVPQTQASAAMSVTYAATIISPSAYLFAWTADVAGTGIWFGQSAATCFGNAANLTQSTAFTNLNADRIRFGFATNTSTAGAMPTTLGVLTAVAQAAGTAAMTGMPLIHFL